MVLELLGKSTSKQRNYVCDKISIPDPPFLRPLLISIVFSFIPAAGLDLTLGEI